MVEKKQRVYFAHSQLAYDTDEEVAMRDWLEAQGFDVVCPNRDIFAKKRKDYMDMQRSCDFCVCAEFMGYVGRGVASGVVDFLALGKPVQVIRSFGKDNDFILAPVKGTEPVTQESDWKVRYATLVTDEEAQDAEAI